MTTLREASIGFQPQQTLNVSDLDSVPIDIEIYEHEGVNKKGEKYVYNYIELNEIQFRIPNPVLEQIQQIVELKPETKNIRVKKSGTGVATKYKTEVVN